MTPPRATVLIPVLRQEEWFGRPLHVVRARLKPAPAPFRIDRVSARRTR